MPGADPRTQRAAEEVLDHLVLATPDVEATVADLGRALGIRPGPGGQHVGIGTRNALLALGERRYLEVIGPDPDQPPPQAPRPFGIDALSGPFLVTWATATTEIEATVSAARDAGWDPGPVLDMQRRRPDGAVLAWRLTLSVSDGSGHGGLVPFLIDWGTSPHPAATAPGGATLDDLHGEHPDPSTVVPALRALGIELRLLAAPTPSVVAVLRGPAGLVTLRASGWGSS
jgi:hypothetical protein